MLSSRHDHLTLADAFLADFDTDDQPVANTDTTTASTQIPVVTSTTTQTSTSTSALTPTTLLPASSQHQDDHGNSEVSTLFSSQTALSAHLTRINAALSSDSADASLISSSTQLIGAVNADIALLHTHLKLAFTSRFAELERLVTTPLEYAQVVLILLDANDQRTREKRLQQILPPTIVLTITVMLTDTHIADSGDRLRITALADRIVERTSALLRLQSYITRQMGVIAPNMTALIGAAVAAQLVSSAGSLRTLSLTPACNIQSIGAVNARTITSASGLSANELLHAGHIATADLVQKAPMDFRRKFIRVLCNKVALAARLDDQRHDVSGETGTKLRREIEEKLATMTLPPPNSLEKPLPLPPTAFKKKRAGKRFRKRKERLQMTEMQKLKNRVGMDTVEVTDDYTGESFGLLGQSGGKIKVSANTADTHKLSNKLSRNTQARIKHYNQTTTLGGTLSTIAGVRSVVGASVGGSVSTIGSESTMSLTPITTAATSRKRHAEPERYFDVGSGFHVRRPPPPVPTFK